MSDYLKKRQQESLFGKPPKEDKKYTIPKVSKKRAAEIAAEKEARGNRKSDLEKWYENIMKKEDAVCWESGLKINKNNKAWWHGSISHVLPKSIFKSVATHPLNYLILSMYGGHHGQYDSSWENAKKMKVWPVAVQRFIAIEQDIGEDERRFIPECFLPFIQMPF